MGGQGDQPRHAAAIRQRAPQLKDAASSSSSSSSSPSSLSSPSSAPSPADSGSAAECLVRRAKHVEARIERALVRLVHWDELEPWRRDNGFIRTGYRLTSNSYRGSLASLAYLHNESVNIWTHLLGALASAAAGLFLYAVVLPRVESATAADLVIFSCFFGGAFLCLGMSATYHTLCNHSTAVAARGNKLDYSGIVFLIVGSYVPALYYGFFCLPTLMTLYLWSISILGLGCLVVSWDDRFRQPSFRPARALMFVCLGVSGIVPIIHGCAIYGARGLHERMGWGWILLEGVLYIMGAFLYAVRWPERSFPGLLDIWGSSHQIFHVCVLLAVATHLGAMGIAFDFHHAIMGAAC